MPPAAVDVYVAGFVAQCNVTRCPGRQGVDVPGMRGLLCSAGDPRTRLLVTDDQAHEVLAGLVPDLRAGTISVFATAERCAELLHSHPAWRSKAVIAMICRDLRTVPEVPLPAELTLRPVRRLADDPSDGVPLTDAVAVAVLADPAIVDPPEAFTDYLRSLPPAIQLFAAVDSDGAVHATSGYGAYGTQANVLFVNTDPDWRRRGIGQAMTAAALRAARAAGAEEAALEASDAGVRIYLRLGLESLPRSTQFSRPR